ncbi:MAG: FAD-dependent oxidoreductase [Synechococcaceae cyanobacterium ELA445]
MLRLNELKLPLDHDDNALVTAVLRRLRIPATDLLTHQVVKRSVDARKKSAIRLTYSLDLQVKGEAALLRRFRDDPQLQTSPDTRYRPVVQAPLAWSEAPPTRPVVIGAGPCGYFAALLLAQMGLRPLLLERGKAVKERSADTFGFWRGTRPFNCESNAQFGEGGAGTFSDGKLYSQVRDPRHLGRKVLEELVSCGANAEILSLHRPHIGTFKLATVVRQLRARIESLGGEVRFQCRMERLLIEERQGQRRVVGVRLADGNELASEAVVLAVGHSARDTFQTLWEQGVAMEAKPFAVGLRVEHPQSLVDRARWGACAGHPLLGAAEYKLVHHASNGRSAYSFCMCPGGLVVGATSEEGKVVTNGMSQHSRNERNANSAIVVGIDPADVAPYGREAGDPLAGMAFQRHWEAKAFALGGGSYRAPGQRVGDFLAGRSSADAGSVRPSYQPGVTFTDLGECLPAEVIQAIREALPAFERTIPGFAMEEAVLTGVETRTSSPVRLPRGEGLESTNTAGLYPAGEGAGYAGGILSAAIDGIEVAEAVALTLRRRHFPGEPDGSACDQA